MEFYIVNEYDKPYEKLVAIEENGKLKYVHPDRVREDLFDMDRSTNLREFGFEVVDLGHNHYQFQQLNKCTATYPDGKARQWQGEHSFVLELNHTMHKGIYTR